MDSNDDFAGNEKEWQERSWRFGAKIPEKNQNILEKHTKSSEIIDERKWNSGEEDENSYEPAQQFGDASDSETEDQNPKGLFCLVYETIKQLSKISIFHYFF